MVIEKWQLLVQFQEADVMADALEDITFKARQIFSIVCCIFVHYCFDLCLFACTYSTWAGPIIILCSKHRYGS